MKQISFKLRLTAAILLVMALIVLTISIALAQAPANDDINSATEISALPFTDNLNTSEATRVENDMDCSDGAGTTVWYVFRPTESMRIEAKTFGSDYDTTLAVASGSPEALFFIDCRTRTDGTNQSRLQFDVNAGETYYMMVGSFGGGAGGNLVFSVDVAPPPPPPLTMEFHLDSNGSVAPKTGTVTLHGTMTCSRRAFADVNGTVQQRAGHLLIQGFGDADNFICEGQTNWSLTVVGQNGRYAGGKAQVDLIASALAVDDFSQFVQQDVSTTVTLAGKK